MESDGGDEPLEDVVPKGVYWNAVCDPSEDAVSSR